MHSANYKAHALREGVAEETLVHGYPLTWEEWNGAPESAKSWWLDENSKQVDKMLAQHKAEVREATNHARREVKKVVTFDVEDPTAVANLMIENGGRFSSLFPQFVTDREYTDLLLKHMRVREMLPELDSFILAFKELAHQGLIAIDASKTGLSDDDTLLTGERLQDALNANPLLLAQATPEIVERRQVMRLSEADFKKWERSKNGPPDVPPMIRKRIDQAFLTLETRHPELIWNDSNTDKLLLYIRDHLETIDIKSLESAFHALRAAGELELNANVVVKGEYGNLIDHSQIEKPQPTAKEESLARAVSRMNLSEYQEKLADSPATRKAVDRLPFRPN